MSAHSFIRVLLITLRVRNTVIRGRFEKSIPFLYLAELQLDIGPALFSSNDLLGAVPELRRLIIYERSVKSLHTNDAEASLFNMKTFGSNVREKKYKDVPLGKYQMLGVSWNELGNAYLQNHNVVEAERCYQNLKDCFRLRILRILILIRESCSGRFLDARKVYQVESCIRLYCLKY